MGILADWQIRRDIKITPFAEGQKRENVISYGLSSYGYDMRLGYKFRIIKPYPDAIIDPKNYREDMYEQVDLTQPMCQSGEIVGRPGYYHCTKCHFHMNKDVIRECPHSIVPKHLDIPAHSFVLGETIEEFNIPRDLLCIVMGKSTYARCGIYTNVTPGEPQWIGRWTVEISNTTPKTVRVYPGEGICQCLFLRTDGISEAMLNASRRLCGQLQQEGVYQTHEVQEKKLKQIEELLYKELSSGTCEISYADKKGKYQNQEGITNPTVDKKDS